jgi:hypothetical protein
MCKLVTLGCRVEGKKVTPFVKIHFEFEWDRKDEQETELFFAPISSQACKIFKVGVHG